MLSTRIVQDSDWPNALKDVWREVVADCPSATPFQTWEWQSTWFRHLGRGRRPHIWTLWEGNDLVGLFPMVKVRRIWSVLRPMGCGPSDYLQPVARRGWEPRVSESLCGYLQGASGIDLVDLHQVRETLDFAQKQLVSGEPQRTLEQAKCLALDLPETFDAYVASLGKSLRYDVRRLDKLAGPEGAAKVETVTHEGVPQAMDLLFEHHLRRWKKRGLPGAFLGRRIRTFHHEWAKLAADEDWLRVSLLHLDGQCVGAIYAMAMHDATYFYQSGFDPVRGSISPGTLLVAHTIRQAIEEGRLRFDFMRGDEPYKRRWKPQKAYRNLRFLMPGNGWLSKGAVAWNGAGFRIESGLRSRLEGKGLV